jgi:hypothetical protein
MRSCHRVQEVKKGLLWTSGIQEMPPP